MARRRPKGVFEIGWAVVESAAAGRTEHVPTAAAYSEDQVRRMSFAAGGELGWRISALESPRERPAPWRIVVVTGAPSWAEYWAPVIAALPQDREMVVVDRPGYAGSEPIHYVGDIKVQARALSPLLEPRRGQKILLVGQSYGAAIAAVMASEHRRDLGGLVLLSGYYGEPGPTAQWLLKVGSRLLRLIPRDARHAILEITGQPAQLQALPDALRRLKAPIHVIHGDRDDFAPFERAVALARETRTRRPIRLARVEGADHFLNDGPPEAVLAALEACIPKPVPWSLRLPDWLRPARWRLRGNVQVLPQSS